VWGRQLLAGSSSVKRMSLVAANAKQSNVRTRQQQRCAPPQSRLPAALLPCAAAGPAPGPAACRPLARLALPTNTHAAQAQQQAPRPDPPRLDLSLHLCAPQVL
jgi:hypothetical protein